MFSKSSGVCSPVSVKFGEHESVKCVVYRGCNLRRNDSVSLSLHQKHSRGGTKLVQILGDS
jgi:hypothetical protein